MSQLHTATLKLTGWYLAILMTVCLAFSVTVYQISSREFDRPLPPENQSSQTQFLDSSDTFRTIREQRAAEAKRNVITNLLMLNLITLTLGSALGYLLAKRTLRPIEEAMEAQARFTSDASHELRTPLAVMRTENEIALRGKSPSVTELKDVIASNLEEVARLQQLTDRLLALSSKQQVELQPFNANDAVADAFGRQQAAAAQKNIAIKAKLAKGIVEAYGNDESVSVIVSILLENAIKYSPEKTAITLSTTIQGSHILISVADQGIGIDPADIGRVFDRFYRADQSRSKQHVEGHGLGLALAQRLAKQNQANLSVTNRKPRGSIFTLQLPRPKQSSH